MEADGTIRLPVDAASGQRMKLQRSENLVVWEDGQTMTVDGSGCELSDSAAGSSQRFWRALEDRPTATDKP